MMSQQQNLPSILTDKTAGPIRCGVLLVYAHPDDEAIAVGGRLPLFADAHFLQVTDGAPADNTDGTRLGLSRDQYRAARRKEVRNALLVGGLTHARHTCLGIPDKEASLHLTTITYQVERLIMDAQPALIFTHPYEAGHADHDACAFAVHTAVRRMAENGGQAPDIIESPFYHDVGDGFVTGTFLPNAAAGEELCFPLNEDEQRRKQAMFEAFPTQGDVLHDFGTSEELYRVAPYYDFKHPGHLGPAFYERFIEGMNPRRFCELAAKAHAELLTGAEEIACR